LAEAVDVEKTSVLSKHWLSLRPLHVGRRGVEQETENNRQSLPLFAYLRPNFSDDDGDSASAVGPKVGLRITLGLVRDPYRRPPKTHRLIGRTIASTQNEN
jgi:hypothetical protein